MSSFRLRGGDLSFIFDKALLVVDLGKPMVFEVCPTAEVLRSASVDIIPIRTVLFVIMIQHLTVRYRTRLYRQIRTSLSPSEVNIFMFHTSQFFRLHLRLRTINCSVSRHFILIPRVW